jgi:hypothetical protein
MTTCETCKGTPYDFFLVELYAGPARRYREWRETWDTTEEQDFIMAETLDTQTQNG